MRHNDGSLELVNQYAERLMTLPVYDPDTYQDPVPMLKIFREELEADYEFCDYFFRFDEGNCVQKISEGSN